MLFLLPQYLQSAQHESPLVAGECILPWTATLFVVAPFAGALADRVGERVLITIGLLLEASGVAWFAASITPAIPYAHLIAPLIVSGVGLSLAIPSTQRLVLNAVPRADLGKGSGTFTMLRYLGGVFGVAVLVAIFNRFGGITSPQAFSAGFGPAMWGASALALLGAAVAFTSREPVTRAKTAALAAGTGG
jgi:MFS family permease